MNSANPVAVVRYCKLKTITGLRADPCTTGRTTSTEVRRGAIKCIEVEVAHPTLLRQLHVMQAELQRLTLLRNETKSHGVKVSAASHDAFIGILTLTERGSDMPRLVNGGERRKPNCG